MNILEILLGQIPEALYFALFMIFTKNIKSNRIIFTILMILEYILLLNVFPYSTWSHILYFGISYIIMKIFYQDECQITDIFTLGISSIILGVISMICYFVTFGNISIGNILNKILAFVFIIVCKSYLPKINNLYKKLWNRSKHKYKMKSTTFRALNVVIFNLSFAIINILLLLVELYWR